MKKGEKVEYDPEKHCGAKTRNGGFCLFPKGFRTSHPGEGRCYRHGGNNVGAKTPEAQARSREASSEINGVPRATGYRKIQNDIYGDRLTGSIKVTYEQVRSSNPYELLQQMAAMFHATIIEGWTSAMNGTRQPWGLNDKKTLKAVEMLVEEGEIDEDYLKALRMKLMGYDEKGWGQLANVAAQLIDRAESMSKLDAYLARVKTMMGVILALQEQDSTDIIVSTLRELVVDSGFPVDECDKILAKARSQTKSGSIEAIAEDVE
jgi:hypothetical protein